MPTGWTELAIHDCFHRSLNPVADGRGAFMELWRADWTAWLERPIRQANLSRSSAGVLRGMHFHERQDDLWVVAEGKASVALVDLRSALKGAEVRKPAFVQLECTVGHALLIPPGVAHGFLAAEALALVYLVTNEYDGSDEHGFAWNDPVVDLRWPMAEPILSERDRKNPPYELAVAAARQRAAAPPT